MDFHRRQDLIRLMSSWCLCLGGLISTGSPMRGWHLCNANKKFSVEWNCGTMCLVHAMWITSSLSLFILKMSLSYWPCQARVGRLAYR